jgi:hypothetical protein
MVAAMNVLAACASTQLTDVQVVPEAQRAKVQNVMVIGLFRDPMARHAYEADMVKYLEAAGVQAHASVDLLPPGTNPTRGQIEQLVQQHRFDGVVVGQLIDRRTEAYAYSEPAFYDWYGRVEPGAYAPVVQTTTTIVIQTRLFQTATGQSQFAASSQSIDPTSAAEVAEAHAQLVVGALKKDGLV